MRKLYIKQKVFNLSGKFTVKDKEQQDVYYIEGSFLQIPKTFTIVDPTRKEIALITKKTFSLLPKFFVEVEGREALTIKKEFTFFKARYTIDAESIEVRGNWWDMNFEVLKHGNVAGSVSKQWLTWGDTYEVKVIDEEMEHLLIALVIAIDCVKASEAASASAT
ncbi:LURP-one-related/scramblase family protein [Planococcus halocryophilus]|uniref:LURP-one-related/scramblase family protein n=1 Tax=Planococcus halocryophilus TaxID=1215089 RepID=UPI001F0FAF8C|nr:LURP-one-related family protein [Planococcus halocryophilus]MCH4825209.1 LURP-one-related family protein [Planococcus halocryophilus]